MKTKSKLSIIAVFSCCAVMSMGFANWVITQEGPIEDFVKGGITADSVIMSNDYVYPELENGEPKIDNLVFGKTSFMGDEDHKGKLTIYLTVDIENCNDIKAKNIVVSMSIASTKGTALPDNNNIIASSISSFIQVSALVDETVRATGISTTKEGASLNTTIPYSNFSSVTTNQVSLAVTYDFTRVTGTNYTTFIYTPFTETGNYYCNFAFNFMVQGA